MLVAKVEFDAKSLRRQLNALEQRQLPFAAARAITQTAQLVKQETVREMFVRFDRPTPMTLKSMWVKPATRATLTARVYLKDTPIGGKNPLSMAEIIGHQFAGGTRYHKRLERWFAHRGLISRGEYLVPGEAARLDQYGNMSRGQIQQMLSQLRMSRDPAQDKTRSARSRASARRAGGMFWSHGTHLPRGVWLRAGRNVRPVLIVVRTATYRQRIDLQAIADRTQRKHFPRLFARSLADAVRTAR